MTDSFKTDPPRSKRPWDELRRVADEVKGQLHRAGVEAKDRWKELEPKLHDFQSKAEATTERAADAVQTQLATVVDALHRFVGDLRTDLQQGKKNPEPGPRPPEPPPAEPPS